MVTLSLPWDPKAGISASQLSCRTVAVSQRRVLGLYKTVNRFGQLVRYLDSQSVLPLTRAHTALLKLGAKPLPPSEYLSKCVQDVFFASGTIPVLVGLVSDGEQTVELNVFEGPSAVDEVRRWFHLGPLAQVAAADTDGGEGNQSYLPVQVAQVRMPVVGTGGCVEVVSSGLPLSRYSLTAPSHPPLFPSQRLLILAAVACMGARHQWRFDARRRSRDTSPSLRKRSF